MNFPIKSKFEIECLTLFGDNHSCRQTAPTGSLAHGDEKNFQESDLKQAPECRPRENCVPENDCSPSCDPDSEPGACDPTSLCSPRDCKPDDSDCNPDDRASSPDDSDKTRQIQRPIATKP